MSLRTLCIVLGSASIHYNVPPPGLPMKVLTVPEIASAKSVRKILGERSFDLTVASNNPRDVQIAAIVAGLNSQTSSSIVQLPVLSLDDCTEAVSLMNERRGVQRDALLAAYLEGSHGDLFQLRGKAAQAEISSAMGQAKSALVVGEPILAGMLAHAMVNGDTACEDILRGLEFGIGPSTIRAVRMTFEGNDTYVEYFDG